jgi:hypothetical protein
VSEVAGVFVDHVHADVAQADVLTAALESGDFIERVGRGDET